MFSPVALANASLRRDPEALTVALVIPLHGPAGIIGPSAELCAQLAVEELNATTGAAGREVQVVVVDGGSSPDQVADEVEGLVAREEVDAVVGWHISAVRQALAPRLSGRVPYVYSALYEGGERTPGVFLTGETPDRQVRPAIRWLTHSLGVRSWAIVGDDYVWPIKSADRARSYLAECGARLCDQLFVPLGTTDFTPALHRVERSGCDAVLMLLVGSDAVEFNRQFAARGLHDGCVRLSPLMDENMLLASGLGATVDLYSAAAFFETLATESSLDFSGRFVRRFGPQAPVLNSLGESCYEGIRLLGELVARAHSADVPAVCAAAEQLRYAGPRGEVVMAGNHVRQQVYLARATGLEFEVLAGL